MVCTVSELSFQEGSVYNSEMECINYEQQSQTEPLDVKLGQAEEKSESHYSMPQMVPNAGGQMQASVKMVLHINSYFELNLNIIKNFFSFYFHVDSSNARGNFVFT